MDSQNAYGIVYRLSIKCWGIYNPLSHAAGVTAPLTKGSLGRCAPHIVKIPPTFG